MYDATYTQRVEKGTRSIHKNVAYFLSYNIEGDEGKREEWGTMALSGAVTAAPAFLTFVHLILKKRKKRERETLIEDFFDVYQVK